MCRKKLIPHVVIHPSVILHKQLKAMDAMGGLDEFNRKKDLLRHVIKHGFDSNTANIAEKITGVSIHFWLNLQSNFEENKANKLDQFSKEPDMAAALEKYSKASPCLEKDFMELLK